MGEHGETQKLKVDQKPNNTFITKVRETHSHTSILVYSVKTKIRSLFRYLASAQLHQAPQSSSTPRRSTIRVQELTTTALSGMMSDSSKEQDSATMIISTMIWLSNLSQEHRRFPLKRYPQLLILVSGKTQSVLQGTIQMLIRSRAELPILISCQVRYRESCSSQTRCVKTTFQARRILAQECTISRTLETKRISMRRVSMPFSCRRYQTVRTPKLRTLRILGLGSTKRNSQQLVAIKAQCSVMGIKSRAQTRTEASTSPNSTLAAWEQQ